MSDLFTNTQNSQSTYQQQVAVQGAQNASGSPTVGLGANSSGQVATGEGNVAVHSGGSTTISIVNADAGLAQSAINANGLVALDAINAASENVVQALSALVSGQSTAQAEFNTAAQLASNAQNIAAGQPVQNVGPGSGQPSTLELIIIALSAGATIWFVARNS